MDVSKPNLNQQGGSMSHKLYELAIFKFISRHFLFRYRQKLIYRDVHDKYLTKRRKLKTVIFFFPKQVLSKSINYLLRETLI